MKLLIALTSLSSLSLVNAAPAATCAEQKDCLTYTIEKLESKQCGSGTACEYKVCWDQVVGGECVKSGSISHIGDMHKNDLCVNNQESSIWDSSCTDPSSAFADNGGIFSNVCQIVAAGEWVHFLVKDSSSCAAGGSEELTLSDSTGTHTAYCSPSSGSTADQYGGPTFFNDGQKGTCSGNAEGVECVWAVQVPSDCDETDPQPTDPPEPEDPQPTDPPAPEDPQPTDPPSGSQGDPHFKTWRNEHFEYHGQCDMVLAKDDAFADNTGLDVQIRTKIVRYWSYIKNAAIRIGHDIFEVEGGANSATWWFNNEHEGEIKTIGGFPVTHKVKSEWKQFFEIDLSSKYPGQKIVISTYKEFVRVDFENGNEASFGKTKGLLGDFKTGATLARDGSTVMHDFWEYGNEWQVLPFEPMLFHESSKPQFPERCILPEDPRGDRRRKLGEATVTEAQAEAACAQIKDALDRKDCLYDVLATQDLGMVGAY